jgi:integrase
VQLPPFLADLYEALLEDCDRSYIFVGEKGGVLRRSNFGRRFWRPAWDGVSENRRTGQYVPPILPGFTFHEGRHTHRTWLADDGIPEVGRAARLGQKMRGMGGIYEHVTPETKKRILDVLQARWETSLLALRAQERARLIALLPRMEETINQFAAAQQAEAGQGAKIIAQISPRQA